MSDVDKIAKMLADGAIEKRIAAAIVLGEIRAKGAHVADALAGALDSGIALLQCRALDALARVGAARAAPRILALLGAREDDVRRAAVAAMVSIGDGALPALRARMSEATADEKRSIDAVLAALGGKDALHALLDGLAASDAEEAKAAAIAVRQRVRDADGRQRRSYLAETQKFVAKASKKGGNPAAIAAGVKILGYIEDDRALPTLLSFTKSKGNAPAVRQEALIALRFLLGNNEGAVKRAVSALVEAAEDPDRTLAQTALRTLAGIALPGDAMRRLEKLALHPDVERARFVMEMLSRQPAAAEGAESVRLLVKVLATTKDKRRAEIAGAGLVAHGGDGPAAAPGTALVREEAVAPLAKALLDADDADRAWMLRNVLRPSAKTITSAMRKQILAEALTRLAAGARNWEPLFATARDADPGAAAGALRDLAHKLRKSNADKALTVLRVLCRSESAADDDRYALAAAELSRGAHDTRPAARAADEALRLLGALLDRGYDAAASLRKDRSLDLEDLYYVGFHFSEIGHPLGEEMLSLVVDKGGRAKIAKMAKSKLELAQA